MTQPPIPSPAGTGPADPDGPVPVQVLGVDDVVGRPEGARRGLWVAAALMLLVVVPLGLAVRAGWTPLLDLDRAVSDALVVPGRGTDVDILRVLTAAGLVVARAVVVLPLVMWLGRQRRWQLVTFLVVAGLGVSPLNYLLKVVFDRARPVYDGAIEVGGLSFPSGHSSGAAALGAMLVVLVWPMLASGWRQVWLALAVLGVVIIGFTRIALGAHFLSDVVAGWSFGTAWVLVLAVVLGVWPGQLGALPSRRSPVS